MLGSLAIGYLGFVVPGDGADDDPATAFDEISHLFLRAETLGFDSAWLRQRQAGLPWASAFLTEATHGARRIALGLSVMEGGHADPLKLADMLATIDRFGGGRLDVELVESEVDLREPIGHRRSQAARPGLDAGNDWIGPLRLHFQSSAKDTRNRVWYAASSARSAAWAGASGFNLLVGNTKLSAFAVDFQAVQLSQIEAYWNVCPGNAASRVSVVRLILPFDGADRRTRRKYRDFAMAAGAGNVSAGDHLGLRSAPAVIGTGEQILEALTRDPVLRHVTELRLELPPGLMVHDYEQILSAFVQHIAPEIGHGRRH